MLPIYLKDRDFTAPDDPIYYLLTRDGLFLVKRTPFLRPWCRPRHPLAGTAEPGIKLTAPPLPADLLLQALAFFRAVYSRYQSEAVVLLAWRPATRTYELVIPHQTVGGGHCDYQVRDFPAGLTRLGTIHSHAGHRGLPFRTGRRRRTLRRRLPPHRGQSRRRPDPGLLRGGSGLPGLLPPERLFSPYPIPWAAAPPEADWAAEVDRKVTPLPRPIEFGP